MLPCRGFGRAARSPTPNLPCSSLVLTSTWPFFYHSSDNAWLNFFFTACFTKIHEGGGRVYLISFSSTGCSSFIPRHLILTSQLLSRRGWGSRRCGKTENNICLVFCVSVQIVPVVSCLASSSSFSPAAPPRSVIARVSALHVVHSSCFSASPGTKLHITELSKAGSRRVEVGDAGSSPVSLFLIRWHELRRNR